MNQRELLLMLSVFAATAGSAHAQSAESRLLDRDAFRAHEERVMLRTLAPAPVASLAALALGRELSPLAGPRGPRLTALRTRLHPYRQLIGHINLATAATASAGAGYVSGLRMPGAGRDIFRHWETYAIAGTAGLVGAAHGAAVLPLAKQPTWRHLRRAAGLGAAVQITAFLTGAYFGAEFEGCYHRSPADGAVLDPRFARDPAR